MRVLVTGGAGFLGHHFVKYILNNTSWDIVILDRIDEAGNLNRLTELKEWKKNRNRVTYIWHDLKAPINKLLTEQVKDISYIFHIAASSHVDRSIQDPLSFVMDNVVGTCNILEFARNAPILRKFFYFSTDEVFGPNEGMKFKEWDRYKSGNPYSASKAGGEELAIAYHNTYGIPVVITHCMNIFGERQHPEKFIPKAISMILNGEIVPIYSDASGSISGTRNYIYADTVSEALMFLVDNGVIGDKYNIEGIVEKSNLWIAQFIANYLGKSLQYNMVASDKVRPGNDFTYGIDGSKLKDMGFIHHLDFDMTLAKVVEHYINNPQWLSIKQ